MPVIEPDDLGTAGGKWTPLSRRAPRLGAVFVHGWNGDWLTTWCDKARFGERKAGLIDFLVDDPDTAWRFYAVRHTAGAFEPAKIADVANTIQTFLRTYVYKEVDAVALIAHSLGGLACRQLVLDEIEREPRSALKIFGLLMYGTPNDGTSMARAAGRLWSKAGEEMRTYSGPLEQLNRGWLERVVNGGDPSIDMDNRAPIECWNVVGASDKVVTTASAAHMALLGDIHTIPKNHRSLTKPVAADDEAVVIARDFLRKVEARYRDRRVEIACDELAAEARSRAAAAPWVATEEETIELLEIPAGAKVLFAEREGLFQSKVTTVRTRATCEKALHVGVRLNSARYDAGTVVAYECAIGDGVLANAVSESVRNGTIARERLTELVTVHRIAVTHDGETYSYAPGDIVSKNSGWFLMPYVCDTFPAGVDRVDRFELEVTSVVDMDMGWYTYFTEHTVTDGLVVTFRAPFKVACLLHEPLRRSARLVANDQVGGAFATEVRIEGPVAAGSRITWVFERDK